MAQKQIAEATNVSAGGAEKIRKNFLGELVDIIEYRGKPYLEIEEVDFALELHGNRLFIFEVEVRP